MYKIIKARKNKSVSFHSETWSFSPSHFASFCILKIIFSMLLFDEGWRLCVQAEQQRPASGSAHVCFRQGSGRAATKHNCLTSHIGCTHQCAQPPGFFASPFVHECAHAHADIDECICRSETAFLSLDSEHPLAEDRRTSDPQRVSLGRADKRIVLLFAFRHFVCEVRV